MKRDIPTLWPGRELTTWSVFISVYSSFQQPGLPSRNRKGQLGRGLALPASAVPLLWTARRNCPHLVQVAKEQEALTDQKAGVNGVHLGIGAQWASGWRHSFASKNLLFVNSHSLWLVGKIKANSIFNSSLVLLVVWFLLTMGTQISDSSRWTNETWKLFFPLLLCGIRHQTQLCSQVMKTCWLLRVLKAKCDVV